MTEAMEELRKHLEAAERLLKKQIQKLQQSGSQQPRLTHLQMIDDLIKEQRIHENSDNSARTAR